MRTLHLRDRILIVLMAVLLPFAALIFAVVENRLRDQAVNHLTVDLMAARESFTEIRRQWQLELAQSAGLVAELPYFKAAAAVYDPSADRTLQREQVATIEPVARDVMEHLDLDFLALTDSQENLILALRGGVRLTERDLGEGFRDLASRTARTGQGNGALAIEGEIEQVSMIPMVAGGVEFGRLTIGRRLDDDLAARVRRMTHTEVAILGNWRPLAHCCGDADRGREQDLFRLIRAAGNSSPGNGAPLPLTLAGERFLTLWTPIEDPGGRTVGSYVLQASLDQALAVLGSIRETLLLLWLVALLAAILLSLGAARQLSRPIDSLSHAARRLAGGDFTARVPEGGTEEIRGLARTFNQMSSGLEESHRQLGEYNERLMERTRELEESHDHILRSKELLETTNRDLREMHAQLIQASKMAAFGELGAGVAHELSQPLTSLKGFAQLALARMPADDANRPNLGRIVTACDHMNRIVSSLKNFARMSEFQQTEFAINRVVEETTVFLAAQFKKHQIHLSVELDSSLPPVLGDANQLQQVFTNLMTNARDALGGQSGAEVRIRTSTRLDGRWVVACVSDNGPGVPEELRSKIFRTFFTTKAEGKGTGLGLSISRGIVQDHGGRLGVSRRRGGGASFYVILPAATTATQRARDSNRAAA